MVTQPDGTAAHRPGARVSTAETIEQAQGVLMACYGYDPSAALTILRGISSSRRQELPDLAAAVVRAAVSRARSSGGSALTPCEQVRLVLGVSDPPS